MVLGTGPVSVAQSASAGKAPGQSAVQNEDFTEHLLHGRVYDFPFNPRFGHPFHGSNEWQDGQVEFDGKFYDVPIRYDIYNNKVLCFLPAVAGSLVLSHELVNSFNMGGPQFVKPRAIDGKAPEFFCQQIHPENQALENPVGLYLESFKTGKDVIEGKHFFTQLTEYQRYWLLKDGKWLTARKSNGLMRLFGKDTRKEIKAYLRSRKISMAKAQPDELAALFGFYETLIQPAK